MGGFRVAQQIALAESELKKVIFWHPWLFGDTDLAGKMHKTRKIATKLRK